MVMQVKCEGRRIITDKQPKITLTNKQQQTKQASKQASKQTSYANKQTSNQTVKKKTAKRANKQANNLCLFSQLPELFCTTN